MKLLKFSLFILSICLPGITTFAQISPAKSAQYKKPATQNISSVPNTKSAFSPAFFILKDSIFEKWNITPGEKLFETYGNNSYALDSSGKYFLAILINGKGERYLGRLENNIWQPFQSDIAEPVQKLRTDGNGLVYAETNDWYYKLENDRWIKYIDKNTVKWVDHIGIDGKFYYHENIRNYADEITGKKIFRLEGNKLVPMLKKGNQITIGPKDLYTVDRKGNFYQASVIMSYDNRKNTYISLTDGNSERSTDPLEYEISFWGFDADNRLIVSGYDGKDYNTRYIKCWEDNKWSTIDLPEKVEMKRVFIDDKGFLCLHTTPNKRGLWDELWRYKDGKWKRILSNYYDPYNPIHIDDMVIGGNRVYAIHKEIDFSSRDYSLDVYEYTGVWKVNNMRVAKVPVLFDETKENLNYYSNIYKYYLFKEEEKYGIQDNKGHIIIHPVFDRIYAAKTPVKALTTREGEELCGFRDFCYELISRTDTMYVEIGFLPSYEADLLGGFTCKNSDACGYCKGKGKLPDKEVYVQTRAAEYVPGRTVTGTQYFYEKSYDGIKGHYTKMTTQTTSYESGGKYKDAEWVKVIKPGGICPRCEGKPIKKMYEVYIFDAKEKRYVSEWK